MSCVSSRSVTGHRNWGQGSGMWEVRCENLTLLRHRVWSELWDFNWKRRLAQWVVAERFYLYSFISGNNLKCFTFVSYKVSSFKTCSKYVLQNVWFLYGAVLKPTKHVFWHFLHKPDSLTALGLELQHRLLYLRNLCIWLAKIFSNKLLHNFEALHLSLWPKLIHR